MKKEKYKNCYKMLIEIFVTSRKVQMSGVVAVGRRLRSVHTIPGHRSTDCSADHNVVNVFDDCLNAQQ